MSFDSIKMVEMQYSSGTQANQSNKNLPLVLAVLGDFSCSPNHKFSAFEKGFIKVDLVNFNEVIKEINPRLQLDIDWIFNDEIFEIISVNLSFNTFSDFSPAHLLESLPLLENKILLREKLIKVTNIAILANDSSAGNEKFDSKVITNILQAFTMKSEVYNGGIKLSLPAEDLSLTTWLGGVLQQIDKLISRQLNKLVHHQQFIKLEGRWRGLHHLLSAIGENNNCLVRVLDVTKGDFLDDVKNAGDIEQSLIFNHLNDKALLKNHVEPFSAIIGDFEFSHSDNDVNLLTKVAQFSSSLYCPFISSASASIFGVNDFYELNHILDLRKIFASYDCRAYNNLTTQAHSRFISLILPKVQSRARYSQTLQNNSSFQYQEIPAKNKHPFNEFVLPRPLMNASYIMAALICNSFIETGSLHFIQGIESGGKINHINTGTGQIVNGDLDSTSITNLSIHDRREAELSGLGFLPFLDLRNKEYGAFISSSSIYQPEKSDSQEVNNDLSVISKLSFVLLSSRIVLYLKVMSYEMIAQNIELVKIEHHLNNWLAEYSNISQAQEQQSGKRFLLQQGQVKMKHTPELACSYQLELTFKPWLNFSELVKPAFVVVDIA